MVNLMVFALLLTAFALTRRHEGTIKVSGILAGLTLLQFGRIRAMVWTYRPGRVYFRVERVGARS